MTSFDPKAAAAQAGRPQATTPPAERTAQGNGSDRTAPAPGSRAAGPSQPGAEQAAAGDGHASDGHASDGHASDGPAGAAGEAGATGAQPAGAPVQPQDGPERAPADELRAQLEHAQQESAAHYDRYVRLQAEFENAKKRMHKEHADSLRYALTPLVTEVAAILDNLERAVEAARTDAADAAGALLTGIEMVVRQTQDSLARFGVSRIEAVGKPFDPALHEAMTAVERDDVPDNQVLEEFQAGYLLHDRVVRPARVSVSKRPAASGAGGAGGGETAPTGG